MGPLVSAQQLEPVEASVKQAVATAATDPDRRQAGRRTGRRATSIRPPCSPTAARTWRSCARRSSGPSCRSSQFHDLDEAIAWANDSVYGLTSSIFTKDVDVAMRACDEIKFGETYVNRENFETMQGFHAGWRKSGIGGADGKHGVLRVHPHPRGLSAVDALRLGDHPDRDPEAGTALQRRHQGALADRRVAREPAHPLLVERVELRRVAQRPVRPDDLVERAALGLELRLEVLQALARLLLDRRR